MGLQQVARVTETLIAQGVKKLKYVTPTCRVGTAEELGINIEKLVGDTVNVKKDPFISNLFSQGFTKCKIKFGSKEQIVTKFNNSKMGSTPAFWIQDASGNCYYIKYTKEIEEVGQIESEIAASKLYKLAGIETPEIVSVTLEDGTKGLASKYVKDLEYPRSCYDQIIFEGFAADAWIANLDTLPRCGIALNTAIKEGKLFKLDVGSSLKYLNIFKYKHFDFKDNPLEHILALVDERKVYSSAQVYQYMARADVINSFKKVCSISDESILATIVDKELAQLMIARKNYMAKFLQEMEKTPQGSSSIKVYLEEIANRVS